MSNLKQALNSNHILFYLATSLVISVLLVAQEFLISASGGFLEIALEFVLEIPLYFLISWLLGVIVERVILWLNLRYPWEDQARKRVIIEVSVIFGLVSLFASVQSLFVIGMGFSEYFPEGLRYDVLTMLLYFIGVSMLFAYHEYTIFDEQKKQAAGLAKELKKQNLLIQYDALKRQIDPHFLFNGLNALASLMQKDAKLSEEFVQRLSSVYRYVLEFNQNQLVTLEEELKFIDSFIFLQQVRYGKGLIVSEAVDTAHLSTLIPPMSLQVTIENALKHNMISDGFPMEIRIESCEEDIQVSNSYRPRQTEVSSTGLGQRNITDRYRILKARLPKFYVEDGQYVASIPLIAPEASPAATSTNLYASDPLVLRKPA
ncbi:MAG: histidine kinase [Bacteroidota bacterium]